MTAGFVFPLAQMLDELTHVQRASLAAEDEIRWARPVESLHPYVRTRWFWTSGQRGRPRGSLVVGWAVLKRTTRQDGLRGYTRRVFIQQPSDPWRELAPPSEAVDPRTVQPGELGTSRTDPPGAALPGVPASSSLLSRCVSIGPLSSIDTDRARRLYPPCGTVTGASVALCPIGRRSTVGPARLSRPKETFQNDHRLPSRDGSREIGAARPASCRRRCGSGRVAARVESGDTTSPHPQPD